ncbi:23S rRNA (uracil(1939)-C(5))-methyltransferase RlmD [Desulfitobacterium sp. AusDCA]|uniref:23S rRNA (uracil(1939)-C(5))-methyltransferase RlmD n=1 Tax=Desulfitobacterium sp. AusDCA TaxID=3240383 RepID=UPI003DA6F7C3
MVQNRNQQRSTKGELHEEIEINCLRLSSEGVGIGYDQGKATFVAGLLPEERGKVLVTEEKKSWQRARLLSLEKEADERVEPPCRAFEVCGGCRLQHLNYAETLKWKERWVRDALERIGKINLEKVEVFPTMGMENPWRYRNKARLHQTFTGELGYYQEKTRETVEFPDCLLISETMNTWVQKVRETLKKAKLGIKSITFRENTKGEGMIIFDGVSRSELPDPVLSSLKEKLNMDSTDTRMESKIRSVWGINSSGVPELWWGQEFLTEKILGLNFKLSPFAFLQVNPLQTQKLYSTALDWAEITKESQVWDLYCGIGTISLALAQKAHKVWGIEENPYAISDAKINAEINHLDNVEFLQGKVEDVLPQIPVNPDVVVLDPPRAGVHSRVLKSLIEVKPERIVYVSCDPGTLARDVGVFQKEGYQVQKVQPVDMFPWTQHVESIIMMTYCGQKDK